MPFATVKEAAAVVLLPRRRKNPQLLHWHPWQMLYHDVQLPVAAVSTLSDVAEGGPLQPVELLQEVRCY
jgi:hypothetical protein